MSLAGQMSGHKPACRKYILDRTMALDHLAGQLDSQDPSKSHENPSFKASSHILWKKEEATAPPKKISVDAAKIAIVLSELDNISSSKRANSNPCWDISVCYQD